MYTSHGFTLTNNIIKIGEPRNLEYRIENDLNLEEEEYILIESILFAKRNYLIKVHIYNDGDIFYN